VIPVTILGNSSAITPPGADLCTAFARDLVFDHSAGVEGIGDSADVSGIETFQWDLRHHHDIAT